MNESDNRPESSILHSTFVSQHSQNLGHGFSECEIVDETIVIDNVAEVEPTSALLSYCKRRFQRPYAVILGLAGLKPLDTECTWLTYLGHVQTIIVLTLLISGYILQFITGFRRDRGFASEVPSRFESQGDGDTYLHQFRKYFQTGEIIFTYMMPAALHLLGYLTAIYVYKISDNEQFHALVEKVFILNANTRRLIFTFWTQSFLALTWLICSTIYLLSLGLTQNDMAHNHYIKLQTSDNQQLVKILLYVCLFVHDFVQAVIVLSYSISCYLLRCYLKSLKEKLLLHTIQPLDWMREICDFRKHLHHLNTRICIPVCCMGILNLSYTFSSIAHLFNNMNTCPVKIFSMALANIIIYILISLVPFLQAAALSVTCRAIQSCGHLVSIRPFVHRNTSSEDLNTILLYASSLNMSAKLFRMPIIAHYLCFILLIIVIIILTFGMCINISIGIF